MKIAYITKKFSASSLAIIEQADAIVEDYQRQGYDLTLRQLYYQFVARDLLANTEQNYKRLGSIINDARLAGLLDWHAIEDRTRNLRRNSHFNSPAELLRAARHSYQIDMWENQPYRVECWIEKDALVGVIDGICRRYDIPYFACRGYTSQSEQWRAAERMKRYQRVGQKPVVIYLGDHDPSGLDMSRDHGDRLNLFGAEVEVQRLALNWDQIERFSPPPNPTKLTDSRAKGYVEKYGTECWELDSLSPSQIATMLTHQVDQLIDPGAWDKKNQQLQRETAVIDELISSAEQQLNDSEEE